MTGFPLVDASMRCLRTTGYINFRMRAMLASFFTHILWQDWRCVADHLARVSLDYEPDSLPSAANAGWDYWGKYYKNL